MLTHKSLEQNDKVRMESVCINGALYFKISNVQKMRPFFMSIVSDSNLWMFISSNGGLTAGRQNAQHALFPYYTDDKITESAEITGSKSIFHVHKSGTISTWEPFSIRHENVYDITRNIYKNIYGNRVVFEEVNHSLNLTFLYEWSSSNTYGFVRKAELINHQVEPVKITIVDGIQNILPHGVGSELQNQSSNLVDAYKRNELAPKSGMGIYALSAIIVDKAEPSEALKANIAWSAGLENPMHLLSSLQLDRFRQQKRIDEETDIKGEKGAYFVKAELSLGYNESKEWFIVADVNKNHAAIIKLIEELSKNQNIVSEIQAKLEEGMQRLVALNAASDGLQLTSDPYKDARHFSNSLFNIMRGGVFDRNYQIELWDFKKYLAKANTQIAEAYESVMTSLEPRFNVSVLQELAYQSENPHFTRLCLEYLPLRFSRRHGDPSRPWNTFSINTHDENGAKILDYEGNWRDIFQNWEALARAFPEFLEGMLFKFLNASTFDGYNPYRVTKDGFDWETIEPDNPWSYIGYWGDHQIIYLLKFLEFMEAYKPQALEQYFDKNWFVYAHIPYKIKPYKILLETPKDTIVFEDTLDANIRAERERLGGDGALLKSQDQSIITVNFIEKILATTLAKLSNFIPEGGIWMNTQRPEWNDANNALVGHGVSMVTLYYLRRFLKFLETLIQNADFQTVDCSEALTQYFYEMHRVLDQHSHLVTRAISNLERKQLLDALGLAASDYRQKIYDDGFSGKKLPISKEELGAFITKALAFLEHSIKANLREDGLYHAYNLMTLEDASQVSLSRLSEMLEGQVAVLSSGYLNAQEALDVLNALKQSALFREDQYSYLLYPNKQLKGFLERNKIPKEAVEKSTLLSLLVTDNHKGILEKDVRGEYHFNGKFKNAQDLQMALNALKVSPYERWMEQEKEYVLEVFEQVFNHKAFTGRSGTFYGYEGLGSIYWHMVSKLLLAVQECCLQAIHNNQSSELIGALLEHYYEISAGIGVHKSPTNYGAFSTDPYSHTPHGRGAQQPGMTGQVKEDILTRFGELGVFVNKGNLHFNPCLLRISEFLKAPEQFHYVTPSQEQRQIPLEKNMLCFTYCQVPVVYCLAAKNRLEVQLSDGTQRCYDHLQLEAYLSREVFLRTGKVQQLKVYLNKAYLKEES